MPVNLSVPDGPSRDLSVSDQQWLRSGSGWRKAYLVSFGSETTLGCTAAHRAVVESPEERAVLGRNALGLPGDCDQARPLQDGTESLQNQDVLTKIRHSGHPFTGGMGNGPVIVLRTSASDLKADIGYRGS